MKRLKIKMFNFLGIPVYLNLLFLLLFVFFPVSTTISIFISVLIHEMAHAYIAHKKGYNVTSIDIGLFSGSASIDISHMHERDSIAITAAGPLSNFIMFVLSGFIYLTSLGSGVLSDFLFTFSVVNLLLFIFNILPILPMDGGEILYNFLLIKNRRIAKKTANIVSLIISILLIIVGIIFGFVFLSLFMLFFAALAIIELKKL